MTLDHDCRKSAKTVKATLAVPYHFGDSGLPNVYLVGIKYRVCPDCNRCAAEIPAVGELMNALARALVQKNSALTGLEIRFLRKRLGVKAADFAQMMDVTPEQVSRWENDKNPLKGSADRFVRLAYSFISKDPKLKPLVERVKKEFQKWSTSIHLTEVAERIVAEHTNKNQWEAEAEPIAA